MAMHTETKVMDEQDAQRVDKSTAGSPERNGGDMKTDGRQPQNAPDPPLFLCNGSEVIPLVTLHKAHGKSHIILDDGCYVLLNSSGDSFVTSPHWFDEAVAALKELPPPSKMKRIILSHMESHGSSESVAQLLSV